MHGTHETDERSPTGTVGKTLIAFAAGALAGGVAVLLTAPHRGKETRQRIRERAEGLVDRTRSRAGDVADAARGRGNAFKEAASAAREAYREEMAAVNGAKGDQEPEPAAGR